MVDYIKLVSYVGGRTIFDRMEQAEVPKDKTRSAGAIEPISALGQMTEADFLNRFYFGLSISGLSRENLQPLFDAINRHFKDKSPSLKPRESPEYHITLIPPPELALLKDKKPDMHLDELRTIVADLTKKPLDITGVGHIRGKDNQEAIFLTVKSEPIQAWLRKTGLPEKDLHITLTEEMQDVWYWRQIEVKATGKVAGMTDFDLRVPKLARFMPEISEHIPSPLNVNGLVGKTKA